MSEGKCLFGPSFKFEGIHKDQFIFNNNRRANFEYSA